MTDAFTNGRIAGVEDCHYCCRRIDNRDFHGDVVDDFMAEIRESRFVVIDLTKNRYGRCFEVGFTMGLDIPNI